MRPFIMTALSAFIFVCVNPVPSQSASQAECAIWLCMPGGFSSGCSAAYSAFRYRVKHRMSPLPPLSSCTTGPDGIGTDGRYELGYEAYESCKEGYKLHQLRNGSYSQEALCYPNNCSPEPYQMNAGLCTSYAAVRRAQPSYIKIWVKGEYLGQYWY
jgi:hypothetical protein